MTSSRKLFVVIAQIAICCVVCRHAHASAHFTEEYTVWPKDNASRLPEDSPWPSCDKTTGSQCPGLIDYLEHFCTREDNQGCHKRNESVSERHVLLKLLPGQHKMDLWETFHVREEESTWDPMTDRDRMIPNNFWFCRVSVTFQGVSLKSTIVIPASGEVSHNRLKLKKAPIQLTGCELNALYSPQRPFWSVFAFRGGGAVTFQDIEFQANSSAVAAHQFQAVITVWDLSDLKITNCIFDLVFPQGAVVVLYSKETEGFTFHLSNNQFCSTFISSPPSPIVLSPLVFITSLTHTGISSNVKGIDHRTPTTASTVVIGGSTFSMQVTNKIDLHAG